MDDMKHAPVAEKHKEALALMSESHWGYVKGVITSSSVQTSYTRDEVLQMREYDYITAFRHGFKHGLEAKPKE